MSLIAAFIPLLFMDGVVGRLLREFSVTLVFAIAVSTVVSLTVTPMICAHFVQGAAEPRCARASTASSRPCMGWMVRGYMRTLTAVLHHRLLMGIVMLATVAVTVNLYIKTPKGYFPQDDTGLVFGSTQAAADISFEAMVKLQRQALDIVLADPAVADVGSSVGASGFNASVNQGRMFISLKPLAERGGLTTQRVVDRLRRELARIEGINVFMVASQDIRVGARQGRAQYQFTLLEPGARRALRLGAEDRGRLDARFPGSSTSPPTASRAACRPTSPSTGRRRRASACASRTSTTRSTTPSRSGRSRPSTPSATSTASSSRSTRATSATRRTCRASSCPARTARRCRSAA